MFGIFANALKVATGTERKWNAPRHWEVHDHRTRAEKERDAHERRRMLRQTGML